jgi:hypothetical protein
MKTPLYRQAFSHSWHLAWKQHSLWPLGLFAAMLGQMGLVDVLTQSWFTARGYHPGEGWRLLFSLFNEGFSAGMVPASMFGWLAFLFTLFLGLGMFFLFVSVVSQGALVDVTARSVKRKKLHDIDKSWHVGVDHFWKVLLVNVLKKVMLMLVGLSVAAAAVPLLFFSGGSSAFFLLVFIVASLVGIVVSFLAVYTVGYIVIEEYSLLEAIVAAWHLFVEHWLVSIEVGFSLFLLNFVVMFLIVVGLFVSLIPAFFSYFFALLFSSGTVFAFGIVISATVFLLVLFLIASVFSVFVVSTWTYLFMQMHKTGLKSHILHWLR